MEKVTVYKILRKVNTIEYKEDSLHSNLESYLLSDIYDTIEEAKTSAEKYNEEGSDIYEVVERDITKMSLEGILHQNNLSFETMIDDYQLDNLLFFYNGKKIKINIEISN